LIIQKNKSGKPLGTAEVSYFNPKLAEQAMKEFDQSELDGRLLCIKYDNVRR
jgi:hypothetical protein